MLPRKLTHLDVYFLPGFTLEQAHWLPSLTHLVISPTERCIASSETYHGIDSPVTEHLASWLVSLTVPSVTVNASFRLLRIEKLSVGILMYYSLQRLPESLTHLIVTMKNWNFLRNGPLRVDALGKVQARPISLGSAASPPPTASNGWERSQDNY